MWRTQPVPPPMPEDSQKPEGATLSEAEIIEKVRKGDIKVSDMTLSEREKYGKFARKY